MSKDLDIGQLLREGTDYNEYIKITMLGREYGAKIRPCTTNEWNEAVRSATKEGKAPGLMIVAKCLTDLEGNSFDEETINKVIPAGNVDDLYRRIAELSGINIAEQEEKATNQVMQKILEDF